MKKIVLLLFVSLAIISCDKDDDSTNANKLAKPTLLTPSNNTTIEIDDFWYEFVWSNVENADQYLIQLSSSSDFSNIINDSTVLVDEEEPYYNTRTYFETELFEDGATYYWRVRAFGTGYEASDYSSSFSFRVNFL